MSEPPRIDPTQLQRLLAAILAGTSSVPGAPEKDVVDRFAKFVLALQPYAAEPRHD